MHILFDAFTRLLKCDAWHTGMNKMVINHLEKLFVTSDASTIVNELEIQHPAARLIVLAAQAQEQEIGDATNFVSLQLTHYVAVNIAGRAMLQYC